MQINLEECYARLYEMAREREQAKQDLVDGGVLPNPFDAVEERIATERLVEAMKPRRSHCGQGQ